MRTVLVVKQNLLSRRQFINFKKGITQLTNYIDSDQSTNFKNLKPGNEIDFGGNEIRNFVSVDRIEKLTDKKYAVEISFATGPL
jgi:hypothetical protein